MTASPFGTSNATCDDLHTMEVPARTDGLAPVCSLTWHGSLRCFAAEGGWGSLLFWQLSWPWRPRQSPSMHPRS